MDEDDDNVHAFEIHDSKIDVSVPIIFEILVAYIPLGSQKTL
jgi:hypothetical protein